MGRFWIGITILILLPAMGFFVQWSADSENTAIAQALESAAEKILDNEITTAHDLMRTAHGQWQKNWRRTAAFTDHAPMDEIDSLFSGLDLYRQTGNHEDFAAYCNRIAQLIRAIGESQTFNWWNLM